MAKKPNFLFIMTDQQRWDTVGRAKPENLNVPNLDRLVREGCNFTNTFCQGPICIPSRASFLTGKYVHQHRLFHNNGMLPDYETTWADILKQNGYLTLAIGRTHTIHKGFTHIKVPIKDSYLEMPAQLNQHQQWVYDHDQCATYPGKEDFIEFRRTQAACDFLHDLKDTAQPFAMFMGYCAPHNPYIIPECYDTMYQDTDFPPPKVFEEDFSQLDYNNHQKKFYDKMQTVNPQKTRRYYYAMVSMIDECLGRLLDTLEKLKLLENTIIIFTSDHGEMLGDHARYAKGCLYEEAVKIPLVIMNKDLVKPGITSPELVESIDLFPTILDYADIKPVNIEYNCRGKSLQGLLEGNDRTHKDAVFSQLADWMMIRTKEWKLSYGYTDGNPYFPAPESNKGVLFDLVRDPDERFNRYDEAGYKDVTCKLLQRLLDFFVNEKIPLHKQIPAIAFENMDEPNIMHLL